MIRVITKHDSLYRANGGVQRTTFTVIILDCDRDGCTTWRRLSGPNEPEVLRQAEAAGWIAQIANPNLKPEHTRPTLALCPKHKAEHEEGTI